MRRFSWLYLVDCAQRLTKTSVIAKNVIDAVPLSEHQFQRELHFSRIERAGNHTEIRRPENPSRQIEVCMIESVVGVHSELQPHRFPQYPLFLQRRVQVDESRTDNGVARIISECEGHRQRKGRRIKPLLGRLGSGIYVARHVGPLEVIRFQQHDSLGPVRWFTDGACRQLYRRQPAEKVKRQAMGNAAVLGTSTDVANIGLVNGNK